MTPLRRPRRAAIETQLVNAIGTFGPSLDAWLAKIAPLLRNLLDGARGVSICIESTDFGHASVTLGDARGEAVCLPVLADAMTRGELRLYFESGKSSPLSRHRPRATLAIVALENALHLRGFPASGVRLAMASPEDWQALVQARSTLVRRNGDLLILSAPPHSMTRRRLHAADVSVVRAAIRGNSYKQIADELSCSTGSISRILSHAAAKLGVLPVDLLHAAVTLGVENTTIVREATLTEAERDVLGLLRQGLSNATIARLRARSERTIANQVSSLLRKTRTPSRRALAAARAVE